MPGPSFTSACTTNSEVMLFLKSSLQTDNLPHRTTSYIIRGRWRQPFYPVLSDHNYSTMYKFPPNTIFRFTVCPPCWDACPLVTVLHVHTLYTIINHNQIGPHVRTPCNSILLLHCLMVYYIVSGLFLLFFWCPCMASNLSVQYKGGLLPDIILLTHEEVLYFQLLIPPKRFDIFPPWLGVAQKF